MTIGMRRQYVLIALPKV